ncbi:MAG TPA: AtpZ/AtpI family protein [Bryobacteraceae bacterium]|nr:AtpZ/AtpI family protein [Bryobacteraceae bacterium]
MPQSRQQPANPSAHIAHIPALLSEQSRDRQGAVFAWLPSQLGSNRKMPRKPDNPLAWLGKYLSLALTLPASVAAGYILGAAADHWLHVPLLRALGILLGMAAGLIQIFRELTREKQ